MALATQNREMLILVEGTVEDFTREAVYKLPLGRRGNRQAQEGVTYTSGPRWQQRKTLNSPTFMNTLNLQQQRAVRLKEN